MPSTMSSTAPRRHDVNAHGTSSMHGIQRSAASPEVGTRRIAGDCTTVCVQPCCRPAAGSCRPLATSATPRATSVRVRDVPTTRAEGNAAQSR
eukprot:3424197-Prymnesium_polylepis.1